MKNSSLQYLFIPDSKKHAESVLSINIARTPDPQFSQTDTLLKIWQCIAYLNSGLHPDEIDNPESGWPQEYIPYALEIWKRHESGELEDDELYPTDAQWAGLCDQLNSLTPDEAARRERLRHQMKAVPIHAHILERIDTKEVFGRISVFYTHRDSEGPYEKWCGEWFDNWEDAEKYKMRWAQELYEENIS